MKNKKINAPHPLEIIFLKKTVSMRFKKASAHAYSWAKNKK